MQNLDHCGMYVLMVKTVDDDGVESMHGSAFMAALAAAVECSSQGPLNQAALSLEAGRAEETSNQQYHYQQHLHVYGLLATIYDVKTGSLLPSQHSMPLCFCCEYEGLLASITALCSTLNALTKPNRARHKILLPY